MSKTPETLTKDNTMSNENAADTSHSSPSPGSESSTIDEILAGNALFFLLDLRPLYDFVNASNAPGNVKDCLRRINLAAASIEGALGTEGYDRAKARDEKMNADLDAFLSQNDQSEGRADNDTPNNIESHECPIQTTTRAEARSAPRPCSALEEVLSEWERKDPRDFPVRFAAIIHGSEAEDVSDHLEYMAAQLRHKGFSDGTGGGPNVTMAWATHSANVKDR